MKDGQRLPRKLASAFWAYIEIDSGDAQIDCYPCHGLGVGPFLGGGRRDSFGWIDRSFFDKLPGLFESVCVFGSQESVVPDFHEACR